MLSSDATFQQCTQSVPDACKEQKFLSGPLPLYFPLAAVAVLFLVALVCVVATVRLGTALAYMAHCQALFDEWLASANDGAEVADPPLKRPAFPRFFFTVSGGAKGLWVLFVFLLFATCLLLFITGFVLGRRADHVGSDPVTTTPTDGSCPVRGSGLYLHQSVRDVKVGYPVGAFSALSGGIVFLLLFVAAVVSGGCCCC